MERVDGVDGKGKLVHRHRQGRRPRHRQEPRRHHLHQQRLRGAQPRHQGRHRRHGRQGQGGRRRRARHERPAREVDADHARQPRGAQHARPRRAAGAARRRRAHAPLRRARPARGLRGPAVLRPRRVRGPVHARHADGDEAQRRVGPRLRPGADGPGAARARGRRRRRPSSCRARSPESPPTTRCSRRRSSARGSSRASPLDDIAEYVNETALFRNQWQFRPERRRRRAETTTSSRPASARSLREQLAAAKASGVLVPQVVYGYFPANGDGNDLVVWTDESRTDRGGSLPLPAPEGRAVPVHRRLLPPDRVAARSTTPRSTSSRWARRSARRRPSCSPPTSTSSTCCCTGSASRWPRRSPSTGTAASARSGASSTRTARRVGGLFRQQYRGGRYSWGYPACPDLEDNATVARAARRRPPRHRGQRGDRLAVPARADHLGDHLPPPAGQVLRRPLTVARERVWSAPDGHRYGRADAPALGRFRHRPHDAPRPVRPAGVRARRRRADRCPHGLPANAGQVVVVNSSGSNATRRLLRQGGRRVAVRGRRHAGSGRGQRRAAARRAALAVMARRPAGIVRARCDDRRADGQPFYFFGNGSNPGLGGWHQVGYGDCWEETPGDPAYNTLVSRPPGQCVGADDEYLPNSPGAYSRAALIDANMGPNRSGDQPGEPALAAGIFLHRFSFVNGVNGDDQADLRLRVALRRRPGDRPHAALARPGLLRDPLTRWPIGDSSPGRPGSGRPERVARSGRPQSPHHDAHLPPSVADDLGGGVVEHGRRRWRRCGRRRRRTSPSTTAGGRPAWRTRSARPAPTTAAEAPSRRGRRRGSGCRC